jgi:hypothetical protein
MTANRPMRLTIMGYSIRAEIPSIVGRTNVEVTDTYEYGIYDINYCRSGKHTIMQVLCYPESTDAISAVAIYLK